MSGNQLHTKSRVLEKTVMNHFVRSLFNTGESLEMKPQNGVFEIQQPEPDFETTKIEPKQRSSHAAIERKARFYQSTGRPVYQLTAAVGLTFAVTV